MHPKLNDMQVTKEDMVRRLVAFQESGRVAYIEESLTEVAAGSPNSDECLSKDVGVGSIPCVLSWV